MTRTAATLAIAALALAGAALPAAAQGTYGHRELRPAHARHALTVRRSAAPVPVERPYDAFGGAGAIVTGPLEVGSRVVAAAFDVANAVFPADPRSPLSIVGEPIRLAGLLAQVPFRVVEAPFRAAAGRPAL